MLIMLKEKNPYILEETQVRNNEKEGLQSWPGYVSVTKQYSGKLLGGYGTKQLPLSVQ